MTTQLFSFDMETLLTLGESDEIYGYHLGGGRREEEEEEEGTDGLDKVTTTTTHPMTTTLTPITTNSTTADYQPYSPHLTCPICRSWKKEC